MVRASEAESLVLVYLTDSAEPQDIVEVVRGVRETNAQFAPTDVKVAALNLVSKGRAKISNEWLLSPA